MKLTKPLKSERGLTIIEVLISAVVFVTGFSILVAMLGQVVTKFSVPEVTSADRIGNELMMRTTATKDTTELDTTITRSQMSFRIIRHVSTNGNLAQASIILSRVGNQKQLLHLYNEFETNKK